MTSNPDFAIATEDKVMSKSVCQQLGGKNHKPILTMKGSKAMSERNLPPI